MNQPFKFRRREWVDINVESQGKYDNGNIKFKMSMIRSILCDYNDGYILLIGTKTITGAEASDAENKEVVFKNCTPFIKCTTQINNTQVDIAKNIDAVIPIYKLIEYSDNYSKTWQC